MSRPDFSSFLEAVRRGDRRAAEELLRQHEPYLRRVIRIRLNSARLRHLLETMDIFQSILATFFRRAADGQFQLDSHRQLRGLLAKMAVNRIKNAVKKERRHAGHLPEGFDVAAAGPPADRQAADRDRVEAVRQRLNERERQVFDLRSAGRSWQEIANVVGGTAHAVRMRNARALERALHELDGPDDHER